MSLDLTKLKPGVLVRLADNSVCKVRGSYMSPEGLALTVKMDAGSICDRNVPLKDVVEIVEGVIRGAQSA